MIYPDERRKSFTRFYRNQEAVNGVRIVEGQKLFVDDRPALIIRAWQDGRQTKHLIAVCANPYGHIPGFGLADLMMETKIALDPSTPDYRDVRVRVRNRTDNFEWPIQISWPKNTRIHKCPKSGNRYENTNPPPNNYDGQGSN
jgi:hypothetical protein